jgi:hypothetical protein
MNRASSVCLVLVVVAAAGLGFAGVAGAGATRVSTEVIATSTAKVRAQIPPAATLPLGQVTIFSNLGPFPNTYSGVTWVVSGPNSGFGRFEVAQAFTPSSGAFITQIDVALSHFLGTNRATVQLAQDNGGLPGAVLRSWPLANQPPFNVCCPLTTIDVSPMIAVGAGKKYWLIAMAGPSLLGDTWDGWDQNSIGQLGPVAGNNFASNGWFLIGSAESEGAFDVIGCPKLCKVQ